jgi:hypothetical protein
MTAADALKIVQHQSDHELEINSLSTVSVVAVRRR